MLCIVPHNSSPGMRYEELRPSVTSARVDNEPRTPLWQLQLHPHHLAPSAQITSGPNPCLDVFTIPRSIPSTKQRNIVEGNVTAKYPDRALQKPEIDLSGLLQSESPRQNDPAFLKPPQKEIPRLTLATSMRPVCSSDLASLLPVPSTTTLKDSSISFIPDFSLSKADQALITQQGIQSIIEKLSTVHGFRNSVIWNVCRCTKDLFMAEEVLKKMNKSANDAGVDTIQKFVGRVQGVLETTDGDSDQDARIVS